MAKGLLLDDLSVSGSVGQKNPMPVRIKDKITGSDINLAREDGNLADIKADTDNIVKRYEGGKTAVVASVAASGDTTIYTPATGKAIKLYWIYAMNDPDQTTTPLIKISIGTTELYRAYSIAHWEIFEGAANEALKINLDKAGSVAITCHLEEF